MNIMFTLLLFLLITFCYGFIVINHIIIIVINIVLLFYLIHLYYSDLNLNIIFETNKKYCYVLIYVKIFI